MGSRSRGLEQDIRRRTKAEGKAALLGNEDPDEWNLPLSRRACAPHPL